MGLTEKLTVGGICTYPIHKMEKLFGLIDKRGIEVYPLIKRGKCNLSYNF